MRVAIDRATGNYNAFRRWKIVPDGTVEIAAQQIPVSEAARNPAAKAEEFIEEPIEPIDPRRIGAQTAKQVLLQRIRDAEREQILNDFPRGDELVTGTVKRMERGNAIESGRLRLRCRETT